MNQGRLDVVGTLVRLGLAVVGLVSGTLKAIDPGQTVVAVLAYDVLPRTMAEFVAAVLPLLEIALGVLLLVGIGTRLVAAVAAGLLLVFVAGVAQAWARGLSIDCGCFGGGGVVAPGATAYLGEILRDGALLASAAWLVARPRTMLSADALLARRLSTDAQLARGKDHTWAERRATSGNGVRRPRPDGLRPRESRSRRSGPIPR